MTIQTTLDTLGMVLLYGWPFIILIWIFMLKLMWKKWPVEAIIIEKRGKNLIKTNDRAGRYYDNYTGINGYRLQKAKDTIPILNYDWVLVNDFKANTFFDKFVALLRGNIGTIFLFRYGSKQYKPIKIIDKASGKSKIINQEIKDKDGNPVYIKIYQQLDPRDKLSILDFEVVDWDNMNFMVQEQRAVIERTKKKSEWIKAIAIPLVMIAVAAVVSIVMIKFSYDYSIATHGTSPSQSQQTAQPPNIPIISDVIPGQ